MAEQMGEINKFMAEIIRLLTDLVSAVKVNEDLLRETQMIMKNSQTLIESLSRTPGIQNLMAAGESLQNAINMLQKGVQAFQIQNALRQVQEFLGAMRSAGPVTGQAAPAGQPQQGGPQQAGGTREDSLIKPSDLFK